MKKLLVLLTLLISPFIYSQTEYKVYIPMRTYHFDRSPNQLNSYHSTEGGNIGAIAIQRKHYNNWFRDIQLGFIKNSYHDNSIVLQYGMGVKTKHINISGNIGLASGYKKQYIHYSYNKVAQWNREGDVPFIEYSEYVREDENINLSFMPGILKNNGIMPTMMITFEVKTGLGINPLLNVSPSWINVGLVIDICK